MNTLKQYLELIIRKRNAAVICIAWALLRLMTAYPAQFPQLTAYCNKHMHQLDILATLSAACLIVSGILALHTLAKPHIRHRNLKRAAIKKIKRILKTPGSDEHKLVMLLYHNPNTPLNMLEPIVKHLTSWGIICHTNIVQNADLADGIYRVPYTLTHLIRQYMNSHCKPS